ncbi:uncharacterized protein [Eurosta solidaginis]|uniref:uncharacterized protein n=1 Tax=Eurosta solidaginis TaxID=178769 RepID=UPI0035313FA4
MHLQPTTKLLPTLLVVFITITELHASALRSEDGDEVNQSKELTKRATNDAAPNAYGPAIKITSSILQLTKPAEGSTAVGDIGLQHHETTLEHPWTTGTGIELPAAHTIYLDWPAIQRDFHLLPMPNFNANNEPDFLQPHDEAARGADAGGSMSEVTSQFSKGLHTQIISSSGRDVKDISDNLDFGEVNANIAKGNYRSSYGR